MRKNKKLILALGISLSTLTITSINTSTNNVYANEVNSEYKIETNIKTYLTAEDAKNKTSTKSEYQAGNYHIYKESNGMLNISKEKGKAGSWINPEENKKETTTQTNKVEDNKNEKTQEIKPIQTGWVKEGSNWYYKDTKGQNLKNQWIEGKYYLKSDGKMAVSEWIYDNYYKSYYYADDNGVYVKNKWIGGYYLKSDGKMAKNEWIYDNDYKSYYYIKDNGVYAINSWQGDYYLKSDGKMAVSEWIYDRNYESYYYLDISGTYARNRWQENYYLKADGKMAVNEWIYDNYYKAYYYLDTNGAYVKNTWIGNYYLKSNGKMAVNEWTPDGYYVDNSGAWVQSDYFNLEEIGTSSKVKVVNKENKGFTFDLELSINHIQPGITGVEFEVYSSNSGKDDVAIYKGFLTGGRYKTTVHLTNHLSDTGKYIINTYGIVNNTRTLLDYKEINIVLPKFRDRVMAELEKLKSEYKNIFGHLGGSPSVYITPSDGAEYFEMNSTYVSPSASSIKLFILAAAYNKSQRGEFNLNTRYTVRTSDITKGSWFIEHLVGQSRTMDQYISYMMEKSDNGATNILIRHLGGLESVQNEIRRLGYNKTTLAHYMNDNSGKINYISAQESADLIKQMHNKTLVSYDKDTIMLDKISRNYWNLWLTAGIRNQARVWDKPGGSAGSGIDNDTAVIQVDNRSYIVSMLNYHVKSAKEAASKLGQAIVRILKG